MRAHLTSCFVTQQFVVGVGPENAIDTDNLLGRAEK